MTDLLVAQRRLLVALLAVGMAGVLGGYIVLRGGTQEPTPEGTTAATFALEIPDDALPVGVRRGEIRMTVLTDDALPTDLAVLRDTDPIKAIRLEPSGLRFTRPVPFSVTFAAHYEFAPKAYLIDGTTVEEIALRTAYEEKEALTVTGELRHFSLLTIRNALAVKEIDAFVEKAKADIAASRAKAEGTTFYSEKAKYYKEMVDKALRYHEEIGRKWPDDARNVPQLGANSLGESRALVNYQTNALADLDFKVNNERDPEKRFDRLKERLTATADIHRQWQSGAFDERLAPRLGMNGLG